MTRQVTLNNIWLIEPF